MPETKSKICERSPLLVSENIEDRVSNSKNYNTSPGSRNRPKNSSPKNSNSNKMRNPNSAPNSISPTHQTKTTRSHVSQLSRYCKLMAKAITPYRDSKKDFAKDVATIVMVLAAYIIYEVLAQVIMQCIISFSVSSIADNNVDAVKAAVAKTVPVVCAMGLVMGLKTFSTHLWGLRVRRALTNKLHNKYYNSLKIEGTESNTNTTTNTSISNIDHRICQDVNGFSDGKDGMPYLLATGCILPYTLMYYTYKVSYETDIKVCLLLYLVFVLGIAAQKFPTSALIRSRQKQQEVEGDFRGAHAAQREYFEEISLLDGGKSEKKRSETFLQSVLKNQFGLASRYFVIESISQFWAYAGTPVCWTAVSLVFIDDGSSTKERIEKIQGGVQNSMYLLHCCTNVIALSALWGDVCGYGNRVCELFEMFDLNENEIGDNSVNLRNTKNDKNESARKKSQNKLETPLKRSLSVKSDGGNVALLPITENQKRGTVLRNSSPGKDSIASTSELRASAACRNAEVKCKQSPLEESAEEPSNVSTNNSFLLEAQGISIREPMRGRVNGGSDDEGANRKCDNTDETEDEYLLKDFSFQFKHKNHVLIQGPSGCGKTSLMRALVGFQRPVENGSDSGSIDIQDYNSLVSGAVLRNNIGGSNGSNTRESTNIFVLPQRPYLFKGSLSELLLYGMDVDEIDFVGILENQENKDQFDGQPEEYVDKNNAIHINPGNWETQTPTKYDTENISQSASFSTQETETDLTVSRNNVPLLHSRISQEDYRKSSVRSNSLLYQKKPLKNDIDNIDDNIRNSNPSEEITVVVSKTCLDGDSHERSEAIETFVKTVLKEVSLDRLLKRLQSGSYGSTVEKSCPQNSLAQKCQFASNLQNLVVDWPTILSAGEKQRVAAARVLLRIRAMEMKAINPTNSSVTSPIRSLLFIDEGTSHLGNNQERNIYRLFASLPSVTLVSICHRCDHEVERLHKYRVVFEADGSGGFDLIERKQYDCFGSQANRSAQYIEDVSRSLIE